MFRNEAIAFLFGALSAVVYFVPVLIGKQRNTENLEAIFLVDLVFGWTVLGWIAALIWAIYEEKQMVKEFPTADSPSAAHPAERALHVVEWE